MGIVKRTEKHKLRMAVVIRQITEHPETWNQASWHCNSSHCVGGWAELHAASDPSVTEDERPLLNSVQHTHTIAKNYLGLTEEQAEWLFSIFRSLEEIQNAEAALEHLALIKVMEAIQTAREHARSIGDTELDLSLKTLVLPIANRLDAESDFGYHSFSFRDAVETLA